jgi:hypothetical protein
MAMKLYDVYFNGCFECCTWACTPQEAINRVAGYDCGNHPLYVARVAH